MKGSSDILSNLALHHNSQFRCRQPNGLSMDGPLIFSFRHHFAVTDFNTRAVMHHCSV